MAQKRICRPTSAKGLLSWYKRYRDFQKLYRNKLTSSITTSKANYFSCWYDYDLITRDIQQGKMFVQSQITRSKHVYWLIAYITISTSTFQDYFWVTIDYMLWGVVVNFTIFRIVVTASFCIPTKNGIPTIIWIYPVFQNSLTLLSAT